MDILPVLRSDKSAEFYADLEKFVITVYNSVTSLNSTIENYCDNSLGESRKFAKSVIDLETSADSIRRRLEKKLYEGVILPFGRGSKYELLESVDDIADKAELVARLILIERVKIPTGFKNDFKKLIFLVGEAAGYLKDAVLFLNKDLNKSIVSANKVELAREKVREIEFRLISKLFSSRPKDIGVILLKELISLIGDVADKSEEAADRVISLAVKYQD